MNTHLKEALLRQAFKREVKKQIKIYKKPKIKRFCWNNDCVGNYSGNHKHYFYNFLKTNTGQQNAP